MQRRHLLRFSLLLAASALAACGARTNVSATSNVTALYSHVWVTVQDVKVNTSATAAPGDSSWLDFPLSTPQTFDLASVTNGGLAIFGSQLKIPTGTYLQLQLLLADSSASLVSSAQTESLLFNDEVEYLDSNSTPVAAPLQLVHPENGIVLSVKLTIPTDTKAALAALGTTATTTGTTTGTSTSTINPTTGLPSTTPATTTATTTAATTTCETTTTNTTTTTPVTTTADNCTGATTTTFAVGIDFDTEHDLVPFTYSSEPGFILNPHLVAYDLSTAGTIQGAVDISALTTTSTTASGNADIEVSAETLSSDGTRHVIVKSTPVLSDGSFVLYPLTTNATSTDATTTTTYDVVIHGPLIDTVIIKSVPASVGAPAAATTVTLSNVALASSNDYAVNVSTATPFTTAGALVQFYQTVPVGGELPYVVARQTIDPFNDVFAGNFALSEGPIAVATYSGGTVTTPVTEAPTEGSGTYQVAAIAANFNDGALGTRVSAPSTTTSVALFKLLPLSVATGATSATVSVATAVAAPAKYNKGELIVSQNGAIVAVTPLDSVLAESSGSVTVQRVPAGTASETLSSGVYDLSAWVWNSSNPSGTLHRQSGATSVDLTGGSASGASISID
jgi:hypothetical protein